MVDCRSLQHLVCPLRNSTIGESDVHHEDHLLLSTSGDLLMYCVLLIDANSVLLNILIHRPSVLPA